MSSSSQWIKIPLRFTVVGFVSSAMLAFILGCVTRIRRQESVGQQDFVDWGKVKTLYPFFKYYGESLMDHEMSVHRMGSKGDEGISSTSAQCCGDSACYEALVHPGMISHPNPQRVALIGRDSTGTLREVLKHNTVVQVTLVGSTHTEHTLGNVYCSSNIENNTTNCIGDKRVKVPRMNTLFRSCKKEDDQVEGDAIASDENSPFDVIIMDSARFVKDIKSDNNMACVESLYNSLTNHGVLVLQSDEMNNSRDYFILIHQLEEIGFLSIHTYEEGSCNFLHPWTYLVAFKNHETRAGWYRNEAEIQIQLHRRLLKARFDRLSLRSFDSSTVLSYQVPPMNHEISAAGETAGRGVFAVKNIPQNFTIPMALATKNIFVEPMTSSVIDSVFKWCNGKTHLCTGDNRISGLVYYIDGYGYGSKLLGKTHWTVDSSMYLFMNHGCNGTFNYGTDATATEMTVSTDDIPIQFKFGNKAGAYSPFRERHLRSFLGHGEYTMREIVAGEEILANYLSYADPEYWHEEVMDLRAQCRGESNGGITAYELGNFQSTN